MERVYWFCTIVLLLLPLQFAAAFLADLGHRLPQPLWLALLGLAAASVTVALGFALAVAWALVLRHLVRNQQG